MIVAAVADSTAASLPCRAGCKKPIYKGQVVLHVKLPSNVGIPYHHRHQYFHADCVVDVIAAAPEPIPSYDAMFVENLRRQVIETGELFPVG